MPKLRWWMAYIAVWIPVASLYAVLIFFSRGSLQRQPTVADAIIGSLWTTTAAAILGLYVWRTSQRLALDGGRLRRLLALHMASAALYGALWTGTVILSIALFAPREVMHAFLRDGAGWQTLTGALLYGLIAGVATATALSARLRQQREAAVRSEMLRTRAELDALRARMDPHFLFNTLHSITALSRSDPASVAPALERLAELLRYVLGVSHEGRDDVPLAEELQFVRDYLALEQLRLGDRLRVIEEIDTEALDCAIPAFTLQPLVENAIRHGIAGRAEGGTLRVAARIEGDLLTMEVADDGAGAEPSDALNASGVGLQSVVQRLKARHPEQGSVRVVSSPGSGFAVRMSLPAAATFNPAPS